MYLSLETPALPHAARHCVAFDLTVPGIDSAPARELLAHAFGASAQAFIVETSRMRDCTMLYVETDLTDVNDAIGTLTTYFPSATLGRVTRVTRPGTSLNTG